jgi:hypothetical protein
VQWAARGRRSTAQATSIQGLLFKKEEKESTFSEEKEAKRL